MRYSQFDAQPLQLTDESTTLQGQCIRMRRHVQLPMYGLHTYLFVQRTFAYLVIRRRILETFESLGEILWASELMIWGPPNPFTTSRKLMAAPVHQAMHTTHREISRLIACVLFPCAASASNVCWSLAFDRSPWTFQMSSMLTWIQISVVTCMFVVSCWPKKSTHE